MNQNMYFEFDSFEAVMNPEILCCGGTSYI